MIFIKMLFGLLVILMLRVSLLKKKQVWMTRFFANLFGKYKLPRNSESVNYPTKFLTKAVIRPHELLFLKMNDNTPIISKLPTMIPQLGIPCLWLTSNVNVAHLD